jgi:hypothetical protein
MCDPVSRRSGATPHNAAARTTPYRHRPDTPPPAFMKRLPLLCVAPFALLACAGARAEWLTLSGTPGDAAASYVQVDPTRIEIDGTRRGVTLRMSLAEDVVGKDGFKLRSFEARATVDCEARTARYVSATYFGLANFVGEPVAVKHFEDDDIRPMTLPGAPPELAARTVNAACSVGGK